MEQMVGIDRCNYSNFICSVSLVLLKQQTHIWIALISWRMSFDCEKCANIFGIKGYVGVSALKTMPYIDM